MSDALYATKIYYIRLQDGRYQIAFFAPNQTDGRIVHLKHLITEEWRIQQRLTEIVSDAVREGRGWILPHTDSGWTFICHKDEIIRIPLRRGRR